MPQSVSSVVRDILRGNLELTADQVIQAAHRRGLDATPQAIRAAVHNIRGQLRKRAAAAPPAATPAVAGPPPVAAPTPAAMRPIPAPSATTATPAPDLAGVLANVAMVNRVVGLVGGVDAARQAVETVRACGGVDGFVQHLELVAGIRAGGTA